MSAYSPAVLVSFMAKPVVPKDLGVEVMCLEGGVVHVSFRSLEEEKAVVVDELCAPRKAVEYDDVLPIGCVAELCETMVSPCQVRVAVTTVCLHRWGRG